MKSFVFSSLLALSLGSPSPHTGQYLWPGSALINPHSGQPVVQSTCFGCRPTPLHHLGKRSASPEPHGVVPAVHTGVAFHPGHATSFVGPTTYGLPHGHYIGKRSAEPHGGYGLGVASHPGYATSYVGPTVYGYPHVHGHHYGKRSAEAAATPDADAHYGLYGYGGHGYGYGVPGGYTQVSRGVPFGYNYGLSPYYG